MKKILFPSLLLAGVFTYAQIGINNDLPQATLDITGHPTDNLKYDGIIAPRITGDLLKTKNYTSSQTGALLYATAADSSPGGQTIRVTAPGYYYFNGTVWQNSSGNDWHTDGNSGTNAGSDFLGTTDLSDLVFKTNNVEKGRFYTAVNAENISFETTDDAYINGVQVGRGKGNQNQNTVVGNIALQSITTGNTNTALGWESMYFNTSGTSNTAVGGNSLLRNTSGSYNIAMGLDALEDSSTGSYNIGIGNFAGDELLSGSNNIAIGNDTKFNNNSGDGQINIGNVLFGTGASNNSATNTSKKIGINISAVPNSTLQIEGSLSTSFAVANSNNITLDESHHTVRIYGGNTGITLPDASTCKGRVYILIGSNGISSKPISVAAGLGIYDDVTNANITSITQRERYQIQSDGSGWIVIGR
ncbi:hypothetical protein [Chryseobacterium angstadtii]|uniref:hypothetical protein n=1 Tax=Chryseobacterium angstadtii TaxID=558151 RepID=UPI00065AC071|nr:hypothetical protein [Chryseobacterium angstadtii]